MRTEPRTRARDERAPFRVVVSPASGRLRLHPPRAFRGGSEWVERGQTVAHVERGVGPVDVMAPVAGRVAAVLGLEGEPVVAGQAVVAIEPDEVEA